MRASRAVKIVGAAAALAILSIAPAALAAGQTVPPGTSGGSPSPDTPQALSLTLAAAPASVTSGDAVALTVTIGVAGAPLRLSRCFAGTTTFQDVATLTAGPDGVAKYTVHPQATVTYRVSFAGDSQWSPASADATVSVRPRVYLTSADAVYRGDRLHVSVRVRPARPGATVSLEQWQDGAWVEWRAVTLGSGSRAGVTWRSAVLGRASLRAVVAADERFAAGASAVRRVRVQPENPYHVPVTEKAMIVVDISQYTLHFFSYGRELAAFACVTGRPSLPTPLGRFSIYAKGMNPGGPYGARIMSYHPPCAIHGTNEPWLLSRFPRDFSHGCTRLSNEHAIWLYDHAPIGTPVWNVR